MTASFYAELSKGCFDIASNLTYRTYEKHRIKSVLALQGIARWGAQWEDAAYG